LYDERKQRCARSKSDVRSDPLHADKAPRRKPYTPLALTLQCNIASATLGCQLQLVPENNL
jgi:hypothetical protein